MIKVLTIGSVCQDVFFPTPEGVLLETPDDVLSQKKLAFELGAKFPIDKRYESLGGNSINVAVGLSKLGIDVSACSTIGDDMLGKWIAKELEKNKIGSELVRVENNCKSDFSAIVVDQKTADRIIFTSHVASGKLQIDAAKIGSPHWIFLGDLSGPWQENINKVISLAKEKKIRLAFNPRQKTIHDDVAKIIEIISHCELLFLNKDEAMEIVSGVGEITVRELLENEEYLLKILHRLGAKTVVITDGARGAWGLRDAEILHAEAVMQKAVDTTGAGDAFTSGFFAAFILNNTLSTCLQWGIANSSASVKEYGGQKGLLNENEITMFAKEVKIKNANV